MCIALITFESSEENMSTCKWMTASTVSEPLDEDFSESACTRCGRLLQAQSSLQQKACPFSEKLVS